MTTKNTSVSIYLPPYNFSKNIKSSSEISLLYIIPSKEAESPVKKIPNSKQGCSGKISRSPREVGRVYRQLSPKSRATLSRCDSNENIRALLGYIRKKRKTGKPARRRRSFPKGSKRSSKKSRRKSPLRDGSSDKVAKSDLILVKMPVPNLDKKSFSNEWSLGVCIVYSNEPRRWAYSKNLQIMLSISIILLNVTV